MIVDSRHILFSPPAIRAAMLAYRDIFPQKQPPGILGPVLIRAVDPIRLGIKVQSPGSSGYREIEMSESEVAAMLIVYCRKLKIPLPRAADKAIEVDGENIALIVSKTLALQTAGT